MQPWFDSEALATAANSTARHSNEHSLEEGLHTYSQTSFGGLHPWVSGKRLGVVIAGVVLLLALIVIIPVAALAASHSHSFGPTEPYHSASPIALPRVLPTPLSTLAPTPAALSISIKPERTAIPTSCDD
ncbi:hypothetical protein ABW19_dt0206715 [Dactylella cylindrospora]|nr:hypothetical protein ABW19_dt0206715 [Dactylella cylindrospora]